MYLVSILNSTFSLFSFLPVVFICLIFYFLSKKKKEKEIKGKKKDDLWHIVKEYLKMNNRTGYEIYDLTLYPRPELKELNNLIYKSERAKFFDQPKLIQKAIVAPKKEKKYPIEDYFQQQEELTHQKIQRISNNLPFAENKKITSKRKRYIVCFRVHNKNNGEIGKWESIEIELFKNVNADKDSKFQISFNQELNYEKELSWIYPMQKSYLNERKVKEEEKDREIAKSKKNKAITNKYLKFLRKIF